MSSIESWGVFWVRIPFCESVSTWESHTCQEDGLSTYSQLIDPKVQPGNSTKRSLTWHRYPLISTAMFISCLAWLRTGYLEIDGRFSQKIDLHNRLHRSTPSTCRRQKQRSKRMTTANGLQIRRTAILTLGLDCNLLRSEIIEPCNIRLHTWTCGANLVSVVATSDTTDY